MGADNQAEKVIEQLNRRQREKELNEMTSLDLQTIRRKNVERQKDWDVSWNSAEWGNAAAGEMGEAIGAYLALLASNHLGLANNIAKKLIRIDASIRLELAGKPRKEYVADLASEMADVLTYLDLWAHCEGIDLAAAYKKTFNAKSDQIGSNVKFE